MKSLMIRGKKGDERILFSFMVVVWFLIGLGVMLGIYISYGDEADVKQFQAEIISDKIADCFINNSLIIKQLSKDNEGKFDFYDSCNFNKEIISGNKFYSEIKFNYVDEGKIGEEFRKPIKVGNPDAKIQCSLTGTHYFRCVEKKYYASTPDNKLVLIDIFTGSNSEGGRF